MLLTESSYAAAEQTIRNAKSDGMYMAQKTVSTNPPSSCLPILSGGTGLPDGETEYRGPSERKSGHYYDRDNVKTIDSLLLRSIVPGHPETIVSLSSFLTLVAFLNSGFGFRGVLAMRRPTRVDPRAT